MIERWNEAKKNINKFACFFLHWILTFHSYLRELNSMVRAIVDYK